ncbi:Proteasome activator complex subunit 4 [Smittium culicis]|uniref:Proteasome activator complex subunit 4 n=1 Tax=Smittium culicis TaxID=133412 RepID=A0A1R1XXI2_9FUNG|nr:Proteasome activator complex subunit 4 [Smittium culicis]
MLSRLLSNEIIEDDFVSGFKILKANSIEKLSSIPLDQSNVIKYDAINIEKSSFYNSAFKFVESKDINSLTSYFHFEKLYVTQDSLATASRFDLYLDDTLAYDLVWPKSIKASFPFDNSHSFALEKSKYSYIMSAISEELYFPSWWNSIIDFELSQSNAVEKFSIYSAEAFKTIFSIVGPNSFFAATKRISKLSEDIDNQTAQKILSEIISGWLGSLKYWNYLDSERAWNFVIPILKTVFRDIKIENYHMWESSLTYGMRFSDPLRFKPIFKLILDRDLSKELVIDFGMNLMTVVRLAKTFLTCFSWRAVPIVSPLIYYILNTYDMSNKLIRDSIGSLIQSTISAAEYKGFILTENSFGISNIVDCNQNRDPNNSPSNVCIKISLDNELSLLVMKLKESMSTSSISSFFNHENSSQSVERDVYAELKIKTEGKLSNSDLPIDKVMDYLGSENDHTRNSASHMLKSMVYYLSDSILSNMIQRFVSNIESLSFPKYKRLKSAQTDSRAKLCDSEFNEKLLHKHSSVIGLSCLILAYPSSIPEWMPNVLIVLISCISDPSPISSTVVKTFSEFRKTHLDTWHIDRKKFTSDQLETLSDVLVSPSYYV